MGYDISDADIDRLWEGISGACRIVRMLREWHPERPLGKIFELTLRTSCVEWDDDMPAYARRVMDACRAGTLVEEFVLHAWSEGHFDSPNDCGYVVAAAFETFATDEEKLLNGIMSGAITVQDIREAIRSERRAHHRHPRG